ncbi:MAG: DUF1080 domain-containing protein [Kiritimatiellae bacterium]|nr:DUF1080 domain-containing protein [Kiritimatiellia bacterium]
MKRALKLTIAAGMLLLCRQAPSAAAAPKPASPQQIAKMEAAAPAKPRAKPEKPRRLLVFSLCQGFVHGSIPVAAKAVEILGRKSGAYETVLSEDMAVFDSDTLAQFDAVAFNNTTRLKFANPEHRKALLDFVKSGKGLVGLHAATDNFYDWPEAAAMMGGLFSGHPWNEAVAVKVEDPTHPLCWRFEAPGFQVKDEIYQFKTPYSRENLRVLLSLDADKTDMSKKNIGRKDGDFAVAWIREYEKGRVFYCSLGHRNEIFWDPALLAFYLDGIQYALGDLPADAAPSVKADAVLQQGRWRRLLNGRDLEGWICRKDGWFVEDETLTWRPKSGYIWTEDRFGDFVLDLDFKLAKGTNSGIFIRTGNRGNPVQTGIEVQILDSSRKAQAGKHDCGAVYDCLAPTENRVRPPGRWNHITVTCRANKIHVALNGAPVIEMDLDRWTQPHKNPDGTKNKFNTAYKDMPREGHIGFQDHGQAVWYRNVRIMPLAEEGRQQTGHRDSGGSPSAWRHLVFRSGH